MIQFSSVAWSEQGHFAKPGFWEYFALVDQVIEVE